MVYLIILPQNSIALINRLKKISKNHEYEKCQLTITLKLKQFQKINFIHLIIRLWS